MAEVFGPPGSGKTTMLDAVARQAPEVRTIKSFRAARHVPAYVEAALVSVPLISSAVRGVADARRCANWIVRLQATRRVLHIERSRSAGPVIFDQGPVYTALRLYDYAIDGEARFSQWWSDSLREWADLMDVLVLLDAPDHVLLQRIRSRDKAHTLKNVVPEASLPALSKYRMQCQQVATRLSRSGSVRVVHLDTSSLAPQAVATNVLRELEV